MRALHLAALAASLSLSACVPSDKQKAEQAEQRRVECLDKFCEGDIEPKRDPLKEAALKLNGQWFIGPREYFSGGSDAVFYWPSRTPGYAGGEYPEKGTPFYDRSVEIFLRSNHLPPSERSWYQELLAAEAQGRLISKTSLRPGLEVWRVRSRETGKPGGLLYVATELKGVDGDPPVLGCDDGDHKFDRCTTGFRWQPGISADLRFHSKHGRDWPEIYQEAIRVLQLLRKV